MLQIMARLLRPCEYAGCQRRRHCARESRAVPQAQAQRQRRLHAQTWPRRQSPAAALPWRFLLHYPWTPGEQPRVPRPQCPETGWDGVGGQPMEAVKPENRKRKALPRPYPPHRHVCYQRLCVRCKHAFRAAEALERGAKPVRMECAANMSTALVAPAGFPSLHRDLPFPQNVGRHGPDGKHDTCTAPHREKNTVKQLLTVTHGKLHRLKGWVVTVSRRAKGKRGRDAENKKREH